MTDTVHPDLAGASVLITGGGSGIGASLTEGFLRQGAKVAFLGLRDAAPFVARMAQETGNRPLFLPCDITDVAAVEAAVAEASNAHGPVTVLVNNAGNDERHETLSTDEAFWDWSQAVNLKAHFFVSKAVIPGMKARGGGTIVTLTSISYMMGNAGYPVYVAANSGLNGMVRALAREFGLHNIRVNALAPGWVLTDKQMEKWADPASLEAHLERQCLKEHLNAQDIVGPTLFLASDASRMVTGQTLVVDGGVVTTG